jgi:hypothetical protein
MFSRNTQFLQVMQIDTGDYWQLWKIPYMFGTLKVKLNNLCALYMGLLNAKADHACVCVLTSPTT